MLHLRSLDSCHLTASWVTIGSFDGVHLGHQAIINQMVLNAHANEAAAVVITFYPHPSIILGKVNQIFYLTSPDEKAALLEKLGVDYVITLPFDDHLASLSCDEFLQMLRKYLGMQSLWAGHDFALGKNRQGNIDNLIQFGKKFNYSVKIIEALKVKGIPISSSQIRKSLLSGNVSQAARMLGRPYSVQGKIEHGDERGRSIGFPTANLKTWEERLLPKNGVYITLAMLDEKKMPSVTNIGFRPTFFKEKLEPHVETHILDYHKNIYGHDMKLEFAEFIRPETSFGSIEALKQQIQEDVNAAITYFSSQASGL